MKGVNEMQEFFQNFLYSQECQLILKLILIFILSGFIGLERASLSKPAGFRTHVLVGISAVLVMECGIYLYDKMDVDPTRIAAQLLSGIGFLGAGTILRDGFSVKGLTTAASLLAVTCIGLIVGAGFYSGGVAATIVVYFVLTYSRIISEKVAHLNEFNLHVEAKNPKEIVEKVQQFLDKYKIEISEMKIISGDDEKEYIKISGLYRDKINKNQMIAGLMSIKNINHVIEI